MEGPALTPETVQKAAEVAKEVEPDVTPEIVKVILALPTYFDRVTSTGPTKTGLYPML